jgi:hypothetical protein|tara:strand:+ start:1124 stop:1549 length:426 start_codon:yes stop_codon:yes gene_type:complete
MLTKCVTIDKNGKERPRYVEFENFRLWEYLVTHKHGLKIEREVTCIWLSEEEFSKNESIHYHSGEVEPVNRLVISIFDESVGYCSVTERFTHKSDSLKQLDVLNSHFSKLGIPPEAIESTVVPGYSIERQQSATQSANSTR